ncbi:MAG: 4Fe-4S dicluster domain-containing protein, partial [bacterium]
GWAGGIMKTSFDGVPIHIPGEYMHTFSETTYGNCDNVSGHTLSRVCGEVRRLVKEFPDRLTMASTGGPVTGNDKEDRKGWQANTRKLEEAGVMGIEYSLSCPQGGDGTEGDIVSQNAALTAKIIGWIMEVSSPEIPKLFKLTGAVTSIVPIVRAIKEVLDKCPGKNAGITLANTFPVVDFRAGARRGGKKWDEAIVFGMSGEGVAPISYNTLVNAMPVGLTISGNGGAMNYKQAAHFLAIGVKTVQFCTMPTKYGYGIYNELTSGVSYLMKQRGIKTMKELIGIARPNTVTDFMALTPTKKISSLIDKELCLKCGNCTRCPYQAITLSSKGYPETDAGKCIGCSICMKKCFSGALEMRDRTPEELKQLKED